MLPLSSMPSQKHGVWDPGEAYRKTHGSFLPPIRRMVLDVKTTTKLETTSGSEKAAHARIFLSAFDMPQIHEDL